MMMALSISVMPARDDTGTTSWSSSPVAPASLARYSARSACNCSALGLSPPVLVRNSTAPVVVALILLLPFSAASILMIVVPKFVVPLELSEYLDCKQSYTKRSSPRATASSSVPVAFLPVVVVPTNVMAGSGINTATAVVMLVDADKTGLDVGMALAGGGTALVVWVVVGGPHRNGRTREYRWCSSAGRR
jgi:hypothetical protein